jgi:transcription termination/antitermination protein NusA
MAVSANRLELLQIADAVAREKSIDRGIVISAMEDAIAKAARARYGSETDVHAEIDPKKGELRLSRHMLVVDKVENASNQISLEDARRANPGAQIGDTIADTLPPLEYGRIAAQSAKQVIVQKVREADRPHPPPRPAISGVQGPHRRHRQRRRQARRIWQRHRRSRPGRGHHPPR